jgi:MFS family permease
MRQRPWIGMVLGTAGVLVIAAVLSLALTARELGARRVAQALEGNTTALATALRIQFERALDVGLPLDALLGVEPVLLDHLERHPEVSFFALLDAQGRPMHLAVGPSLQGRAREQAEQAARRSATAGEAGSAGFHVVRTPVQAAAGAPGESPTVQGWLLSAYPADFIDRQIRAVVTDLAVAMLIALILAIELLRLAGRRQGWGALLQFRAFLQDVQHGRLATRSPLAAGNAWGRLGDDMNRRLECLRQRVSQALEAPDRAGATPLPPPADADAGRSALRAWAERHGLLGAARRWRDSGELALLRMVVFLTALSEELVRPFMAVHASDLDGPLALRPEALAGIPLSAFLLTWALSQPFGAGLLQRHGSARCLGAATAAVGVLMAATAFTRDWSTLVLLRALTGVAFGFVLIFSQTLMLRLDPVSGRASAIAEFVGAVVAAGICGPVIGSLMSVKLGPTATLLASALCALTAFGLARGLRPVAAVGTPGRALSWASLGALARHRRLLTLLLCSAIPGKMAGTSVLLLVIPLAVAELGESPTLTGRLLLLFFLAYWLVGGWAGRLSDQRQSRKAFVVSGGLLSAIGCAAGFAVDGWWGLVLLSSLLGLGQAWLSSPQIVWAMQMADQDTGGTDSEVVLGVYRLVERFGGALGPLVVAALIGSQGLRGALLWLALALALGSGVMALSQGARAPALRPGVAA